MVIKVTLDVYADFWPQKSLPYSFLFLMLPEKENDYPRRCRYWIEGDLNISNNGTYLKEPN